MIFEPSWLLLIVVFALGISAENFPKVQVDSYLEFCENGELRRVSPANSTEAQYPCEGLVQFNFEPGETTKRIRIFGLLLQWNLPKGYPIRLWFGHGQCKDMRPGIGLKLQKDGIWHEYKNGTMAVLFNRISGRIQLFRLPAPAKNVIKVSERSVLYTIRGDVVNLPGPKGNYCLAALSGDNRKHILRRILDAGGYLHYGGNTVECPASKYFITSVQSLALHIDSYFESCELPCEASKEEGSGPGPLPARKDGQYSAKQQPSDENQIIPQEIIDNPLENITLELFTKEMTDFVEDNFPTTLSPLSPDETDVELRPRLKRSRQYKRQPQITCVKDFRNK